MQADAPQRVTRAAPHDAGRRIESVAELDFTPVCPKVHPSPRDWRDVVLYELMIDRFDDGKDHPAYDPAHPPAGKADHAESKHWQGGTLAGVTRRLDYIKNLGAGGIWLTSPLKQRADDPYTYHGYGVQDFLAIDPHYGTLADFQELVREAHARGLYVVLDIVIDHTADAWEYASGKTEPYVDGRRYNFGHWHGNGGKKIAAGAPPSEFGPDDAIWPRELQRVDAFNRMGAMVVPGHAWGDDATDGDFMTLKVLALESPPVMDAIIKIYKYWIASTDLDGFRIDAYRHVRPASAAKFNHAIREYAQKIGKDNFIQIGESSAPWARYRPNIGSNTALPREGACTQMPQLDANLDFTFWKLAASTIAGKASPWRLAQRFVAQECRYRDPAQAGKYFVTFIENHDGGAFASPDLRRLLHDDPDPRLSTLAATLLLTSVGIPCLYYGQEQGFAGGTGSDEYLRECMFGGTWGAFGTAGVQFFHPRHPIYQSFAKIAQVRSETPALRYGRQFFRQLSFDGGTTFADVHEPGTMFAYSRVLDTDDVLVVINTAMEERSAMIALDPTLSPAGSALRNVLDDAAARGELRVGKSSAGIATVGVTLAARSAAIYAPELANRIARD